MQSCPTNRSASWRNAATHRSVQLADTGSRRPAVWAQRSMSRLRRFTKIRIRLKAGPWIKLAMALFLAAPAVGGATTVRMQTALGDFYIELFDGVAPLTVANFMTYVASGAYANSFIHRNVAGFVLQGGGYAWSNTTGLAAIPQGPSVANEFKLSNLRGTIAMAKLGGDPNSATNQWFINLGNNAANLDVQNGGFTVFGQVIGDGMQVVDAISALQTVNASNGDPNGLFAFLPLVSLPGPNGYSTANLVMVNAVTAVPTTTQALAAGWNLIGNGTGTPIYPPAAFGDAAKVTTVWKWGTAKGNWAFYSPGPSDGGANYAASKGYDVLTSINAGEGFWINATEAFTVQLPAATALTSASFQGMGTGWNLIGVGDNPTPGQFTTAVGVNIASLWAWDTSTANWYFYAPGLEANGTLPGYITGKGYLDFTSSNKTLGTGSGFWVNRQ